ncbi:MAG: hypothetical protein OXI63_21035 [Candidatus Poribacteria bacterium]|nr:hypothetical protein [Candidatus Poribacteria bacterium]
MGHQVTLDIPNAIYQLAQQVAKTRGTQLENVLVDVLNAYWSSDEDLLSDASKLAIVTSSIESTDWWDVEGDKEWDEWTP